MMNRIICLSSYLFIFHINSNAGCSGTSLTAKLESKNSKYTYSLSANYKFTKEIIYDCDDTIVFFISRGNDHCYASPSNIHWYKNDVLIEGANEGILKVTDPGIYKTTYEWYGGLYGGKYSFEIDIPCQKHNQTLNFTNSVLQNDRLSIEFPHKDPSFYLEVYDLNGYKIKDEIGYEKIELSFAEVPAGVYIYFLKDRNGIAVRKGRFVKD